MAGMRAAQLLELPITLSPDGADSLPTQLATAIRDLIDTGVLDAGDALPSTRAWAKQLGVSRGTMVTAFEQLSTEGYLEARRGSATRVNPRLAATHPGVTARPSAARPTTAMRPASQRNLHTPSSPNSHSSDSHTSDSHASNSFAPARQAQRPPVRHDLTPDRPSTEHLITPAWRAAWRTAAETVPGRLPPAGHLALRQQIVEHLRRMRGMRREAEDVVITAGAREGLALLLHALFEDHEDARGTQPTQAARSAGARLVGVESPGYPSLRRVATRLGAQLQPLPVDTSGLLTDALPVPPSPMPVAVIVTPSHQYPLGGSLPVDRRRALLEWARQHRVVVIEDDYDSELRYVGQPLPALAALDQPDDGVVVTLGTYSKTVAPNVATGFLIAGERLRERIVQVRRDLSSPVSAVTQTAFAAYLASGELRRHTARMRRIYRQRRSRVLTELREVPGITVFPMDGGLHAVLELDGDVEATSDSGATGDGAENEGAASEAELMRSCVAAGIGAAALSTYWSGGDQSESRFGLVIGYGHLSEEELDAALRALARVLRGRARPGAPPR